MTAARWLLLWQVHDFIDSLGLGSRTNSTCKPNLSFAAEAYLLEVPWHL